MTIKFDKKDHVVNVWFADDINGNNLMTILRRREDRYTLDVRVRQRVDDKIYDSKDKKDFYQATMKPGMTEEAALATCSAFWVTVSERYCMHQINQRVDGGVKKFTKVMRKYEAFHCKEAPTDSDSEKNRDHRRREL